VAWDRKSQSFFSNIKINRNMMMFLTLCVSTRIITAIYYYEDIDSLRFALAAHYYTIEDLRPHFPGYPVYCFILKLLFLITGSVGLASSIIGGVSIFIIANFISRIATLFEASQDLFIHATVFFNPLLWMMSNRYMPDLFGLSIAVMALYFILQAAKDNLFLNAAVCTVLAGLLLGVRLSYLPFISPLLFVLWSQRKNWIKLTTLGLISISIWLIPLIIDTGWNDLIQIALRHTDGHFNDWGGTISSANENYSQRSIMMFKSIWADGLGGWWINRDWFTLLTSLSILALLIPALISLKKIKSSSQ
jgi:hypothetical protein